MKNQASRKRRDTRIILVGIATGAVLAVGFILAMEFRASRDAPHLEADVTQAPDSHPAAATDGGPDMHFTTTFVDFGVVPLGKEVGYAFSYANIGAKTLTIEDVSVRAVQGC